ncbi:MAG: methyltransferase domain-containing protein, partial [Candidatus Omnitrophota bacterium]|nr:methyltransferase domain-containing protein [Candidatus Omnitrophota bacterium]
ILYRRVTPPGLAKQQNVGVACVDPAAQLIGFLDDDIVLESGALEAMMAFWEQAPSEVGGAGFNVLDRNEVPRATWLKSFFCLDSSRRGVVLRSGYQTRIGTREQTAAVEWLNSGTTVWRRHIVEHHPFDEWFHGPAHLYDVDFSYAVSHRYRLMVVAPAQVREVPSPARRWDDDAFGRWQVKNRVYFVKKHAELSLAWCGWALVGQTLANLVRGLMDRDVRFLRRARGNLAGWVEVARDQAGGPATRGGEEVPGHADGPALTAKTAKRYGYLWSRSTVHEPLNGSQAYHFDRMQQDLSLPSLQGLVLDAGCGDGIDLANQARQPGVEIIGVELSVGGARASAARCRTLSNARVLQADLSRLPFGDDTFDFIYSYGVLHHLLSPTQGLLELVRVLKPASRIAVYLYEDFRERSIFWRWFLAGADAGRRLTTALPPAVLYRCCQLGSPIIWACFALPYRLLSKVPRLRPVAAGFPFRHARGPFSLTGDLYDRFSAPIERRYTRADALAFFQQARLQDVTIANDRGWMVAGTKP